MSEDVDARHELTRLLFYLITIAAEDAASLATEGQSKGLASHYATASATSRELGIRIEVLSLAITELIEGVQNGDVMT